MRLSIGLIFGLTLLWSIIFSSIYVIFRMVLLKDSPGSVIDLLDVDEPLQNNTTILDSNKLSSSGQHEVVLLQARYAYVTLLHGIDSTFSYRGFLYNCLIVKKALDAQGSIADFIVLVGFTYGEEPKDQKIRHDLDMMRRFGIKLHFLPRMEEEPLTKSNHENSNIQSKQKSRKKIPFLEMALLKITPWSFMQYEKIQFFDGDVLPHKNMDCFFDLDRNTFNTGNASPLNSGWFVAVPNITDFETLRRKAIKRMHGKKWDEQKGWGTPLPSNIYFRGGKKAVTKWSFNGASLDQGLLTDHFALHEGRVQLVDTEGSPAPVRRYGPGYHVQTASLSETLQCCTESSPDSASARGKGVSLPTDYFYHYTGKNKPWLQDLTRPKDHSQRLWAQYLDALRLSVNSSNINKHALNSPLGYFYPNK